MTFLVDRSVVKSSMILKPHTIMYMINNTAVQYGGGILVNMECVAETPCMFQIDGFNGNITELDVRIEMEGNKAGSAGDSIFGGCLESCYLQLNPVNPATFPDNGSLSIPFPNRWGTHPVRACSDSLQDLFLWEHF